jgi:hypothetical protein
MGYVSFALNSEFPHRFPVVGLRIFLWTIPAKNIKQNIQSQKYKAKNTKPKIQSQKYRAKNTRAGIVSMAIAGVDWRVKTGDLIMLEMPL